MICFSSFFCLIRAPKHTGDGVLYDTLLAIGGHDDNVFSVTDFDQLDREFLIDENLRRGKERLFCTTLYIVRMQCNIVHYCIMT